MFPGCRQQVWLSLAFSVFPEGKGGEKPKKREEKEKKDGKGKRLRTG